MSFLVKKFGLLICIAIVAWTFSACKKAPLACFTIDKPTAAAQTPIVFDASCSKNAKTFTWLDFGTIVTGDRTSPKITMVYYTPGTYTIKLQVMNGGKEDIISHD